MASVKIQVIQKYLETKTHPCSAKDFLSKFFENKQFTPILKSKGCYSRKNKSALKLREPSFKDSSPFRTSDFSVKTTEKFFKKRENSEVLNSESFDLTRKSLVSTPKLGTLLRSQKLQNSLLKKPAKTQIKPKKTEQTVSHRADIDKLWRRVIGLSNGIEIISAPQCCFKVFIGPGNNSSLIKRLISSRIWWKVVESKENANFVWTQWKDLEFLRNLQSCSQTPSLKPDQKLPNWPNINKNLLPRVKIQDPEFFGLNLIQRSKAYRLLTPKKIVAEDFQLYNKLEFNECLTNKTGLYQTMKTYYKSINEEVFNYLPVTFDIRDETDTEFVRFTETFTQMENKKNSVFSNVWILKPGENSNRGNGIQILNTLDSIRHFLKPDSAKSYILQKYIENPLLIHKRKFDIRCYSLITSINGVLQGYFYQEGYLRTTSYEYTVENISNQFIHLTNDAIQKHSADYGRFESANKLSYKEFQRYLDLHHSELNFSQQILPQMKKMVKDTILAAAPQIDKNKRMNCFEIFGYDFMIDSEFKPWLIEVNTNPCLELASLSLRVIIPAMLENAFKLVVDSLYPAPGFQHQQSTQVNRFELIFHQDSES